MKSSSSLVSPSLAEEKNMQLINTVQEINQKMKKQKCLNSRLGDVTKGLIDEGEKTLGELSFSSLKLKLFLFKDSAPVTEAKRDRGSQKLKN